MNNRQESKLSMSRAVEGVGLQYASVYAGNVAFKAAFELFRTKIAAILSAAQQDASVITGITADKNVSKEELCSKAAELASVAFAYASTVGSNALKNEVDFSYSKLFKLRDDLLAPNCQNIHDRVAGNAAALADYGVTAAMTTELQQLIDRYSADAPKPRTAMSSRKATTAALVTLFEELDDVLKNRLDKIIVLFEKTHPDFAAAYGTARRIIEQGAVTTQLKGIVTDKPTGSPIKNAAITAAGSDDNNNGESFTATTDAEGEYEIRPITHGKYNVTVTAAGYQTIEAADFDIILGDINRLNIEMVK